LCSISVQQKDCKLNFVQITLTIWIEQPLCTGNNKAKYQGLSK